MKLIAGASTQSRAHRPLPPGAVSGVTQYVNGVRESVIFTYDDWSIKKETLLSWVGGQAGLLFGGPSLVSVPFELYNKISVALVGTRSTHGSYGHAAEHELTDALGLALDGVFSSSDVACRFGLSGRDALDAAVRVARAATGRVRVASDGSYHGAGEALIHPPFPQGVPTDYQNVIRYFKWGDVEAMRDLVKFSAALVVDAPALSHAEIAPFLAECRKACDDCGTIFILDEVVTGFRLGLRGAAGLYGVKPDIACYGKAMSATGGVSAVVGKTELLKLLDGVTFFSQTFGGMPGPCAVAAATINWLRDNEAYAYGHLNKVGRDLQDGLNELGVCTVGQPERSVMKFGTDAAWLTFCSRMIGRGIMVHRPQFPTLVHTAHDVAQTLEAARKCL